MTARAAGAVGAPRVTAVLNQKGGVGKTTTAVNVAGALADAGRRALVVDLDPQGHATGPALGLAPASGPATLAAALTGAWAGDPGELVVEHSTTGAGGVLGVVPTSAAMLTVGLALAQLRGREHRLTRVLAPLSGWDHVVLDCPPSLDVISDNALTAADDLLVPVEAEDGSMHALGLLAAQIDVLNDAVRSTPLHVAGLVVTRLRRPPSTLAASVLDELAAHPWPVLAHVPALVVVGEAWRAGQAVTTYAPTSEPATAYRTVATHLHPAHP